MAKAGARMSMTEGIEQVLAAGARPLRARSIASRLGSLGMR
jgi:hypothetical protein